MAASDVNWDFALVVAGHALSFAGFSALFVLVAIGRKASPHRTWVLLASAATALWALASVASAFFVTEPVVIPLLEWPRIAGWLILILALLSAAAPARAASYRRLGILGIGAPLVAVVVLTVASALGGASPTLTKVAHTGEAIAIVTMIVFGLALLETLARWMSARGRAAATNFFLGIGALLAVDLFLYAIVLLLGRVDVAIYEARGFISFLAVPLITIALARQRDWLVDLHISRQVIVNAATLMGVGIYLLAMALAGVAVRQLDTAWGPALHVTFLAGALILLASILSSEGFKPRLTALVSRHFYSAKYDYRREWLRFSAALSAEATTASIEDRVLDAILDSVACARGILWLRLDDDRGFVIAAARPSEILLNEEPCSALTALMQRSDGPTGVDPTTPEALEELRKLGLVRQPWAAIPLRHRGQMTGFLVLSDPLTGRRLDNEDREFLQALGVQAGAHLTEERAAISVDRARRFESAARQLTYIGHDLKNIVSQLSMVLQNWTRHRTNEAFLSELPTVLNASIERMKALLEGLRTNNVGPANDPEDIEIHQCLAGLLPLWRARYGKFQANLTAPSATVRGRRDQLQSVFDQLVCNAIDASDGTGPVTLDVRLDASRLRLTISDCGRGISSKSVVDSRFNTSASQKPGGFGVGLFQIRDYVRRLGGTLSFASIPGAGTTATLLLPVQRSHSDAEFSRMEDPRTKKIATR